MIGDVKPHPLITSVRHANVLTMYLNMSRKAYHKKMYQTIFNKMTCLANKIKNIDD